MKLRKPLTITPTKVRPNTTFTLVLHVDPWGADSPLCWMLHRQTPVQRHRLYICWADQKDAPYVRRCEGPASIWESTDVVSRAITAITNAGYDYWSDQRALLTLTNEKARAKSHLDHRREALHRARLELDDARKKFRAACSSLKFFKRTY